MLGGWALPTAGGQPRHCTGVRPNLSSAVGSENTAKPVQPERTDRLCAVLPRKGYERCRWGRQAAPQVQLLDFGGGARFDQLLQGSFGVGLGNTFLDVLRSAVDQVLGFLQAQ